MSDTLSLTTPVTVAGGGSWGTALAHLLAARGLSVTLWLRDAEVARAVNERHENPRYLPGFALDACLAASTDPAVLNRDLLVLAVPSQQLRGWLGTHRKFFRPGPVLVNAAKGLETGSLATCGAVVAEALAGLEPRYSVLSGPSFAAEVLRGLPTAVVLAARDEALGLDSAGTEAFRPGLPLLFQHGRHRRGDGRRAQERQAAIAAGVCDGLGLGAQTAGPR